MDDLSQFSIAELGALICEALRAEGVPATLSGGACAEIYSAGKYVTGDLDFVVDHLWSEHGQTIERVMSSFGFEKRGRIYINEKLAYSVEFPPGPLAIGDECQIRPVQKKLRTGTLSLLSPTDSVKDRLTGYFYGNDQQCLEQAVMICQKNRVDLNNIRDWAKKEARPEKSREFERRLSESARKGH